MFDFEVKIAQNKKEIDAALRLRYEVFKQEMAQYPESADAPELDEDIYDTVCDHLIVIDKMAEKLVGTYRLLRGSKVDGNLQFYSEKIFDLSNIKKLANNHEILELGRSCIHKDYRTGPVINLLWSGIAKYMKDYNIRYLFGSVRLLSNEPKEVSKTFKFIRERFYAGPELRVSPWPKNKFIGLDHKVKAENPAEIFRKLPPLVKGYLRVGVLVCSLPAFNRDLGSVVIFVLLDTQKISPAYRRHFL